MLKKSKFNFWLSLLFVAMLSLFVFACGGGGSGSGTNDGGGSDGDETVFVAPEHPGTGTEADPFLVYSVETLQHVGKPTTDGDYDTWTLDAHYKQLTNIDLSSVENWTPIGDWYNRFTGSYDGNNKVISNLTTTSTGNSIGLFGYIQGNGTTTCIIKNIGLENVTISGGGNVGGVVGSLYQTTVKNCYVAGSVTGSGSGVGGVVGGSFQTSTVENCYATASVTGLSSVGGVVGSNQKSTVKNCYATGNVSNTYPYTTSSSQAGGIVGFNTGPVENCYATGRVSCIVNTVQSGGIVGDVDTTSIKNCVGLNTTIQGDPSNSGRILGHSFGGSLSNNYARSDMLVNGWATTSTSITSINGAGITSDEYFTATWWTTSAAWDTSIWDITDGKLPTLKNVGGIQNPTVLPIPVID